MSDATVVTAGINASKGTLDMAIHGRSAVMHVPNTTIGWKQLADTPKAVDVQRVGIEATGGYERGVMGHLRRLRSSCMMFRFLAVTSNTGGG